MLICIFISVAWSQTAHAHLSLAVDIVTRPGRTWRIFILLTVLFPVYLWKLLIKMGKDSLKKVYLTVTVKAFGNHFISCCVTNGVIKLLYVKLS